MADNIANAIIELMVQLKGAPEAANQMTALFSSIKTGFDGIQQQFASIKTAIDSTGLSQVAKDIGNAKINVKFDSSSAKKAKKDLEDLEKAAIRAFDKANPDNRLGAEARDIRARRDSDISDIKARGKLKEGFAGNLSTDEVARQVAARKKQAELEERNLKERRFSHEKLISLNNEIGNQTESEIKALARQTKELKKQEDLTLRKLKAQRESRLNRLDPNRKEKQEIEARHKARVAETNSANELNRIEGKSLITATQKRKEIEASQKIKELELRDIKEREMSQKELLKLGNEVGNQTKSEMKAIQQHTKELEKQEKLRQKQTQVEKDRQQKKQKQEFGRSVDRGLNAALTKEDKQRRKLIQTIKDVKNARKANRITKEKEIATTKRLLKELANVGKKHKQNCKVMDDTAKKRQQSIRQMTAMGHQLENAGRSISFLGQQLIFFGIALAAAFLPAIVSAAQFEQSVVDTVAVIEGSDISNFTGRVADLSKTFLELGENSEFTASQISGGAKQLALAGFDTQEIKDSIEAVADLATVGDLAAQDAARIAANITKAFKLDAGQFTDVADVLTAVATNSNTTIQSIAESFKLLAPIASNLGQEVSQVAATIGVLGNSGISGSRAGTGTSRFLSELLEKSEDFNDRLQSIDSSFQAIDPRNKNISQIIKEFERLQRLGKLDTQDFFELFDERSARVVVTLLNQGSEALDDLVSKTDAAAGLAKQIKDIKLDTLAGDFKLLKSTLDTLFSEVGNSISPLIREWVQWIKDIVQETTNWVEQNRELTAAIIEVSAKIGVGIAVIGTILTVIGGLATAVGAISLAFSVLAPIVTGVVSGFTALAAFATPLGAIVIVIGSIYAAYKLVRGVIWGMVDATKEYNKNVKDPAVKRALAENEKALIANKNAAIENAEAIRDAAEARNLFSRLPELKPLELKKLLGDKTQGDVGVSGEVSSNLINSIEIDNKTVTDTTVKLTELEEKLLKLKDLLSLRSSQPVREGVIDGIKGDIKQLEETIKDVESNREAAQKRVREASKNLSSDQEFASVFDESIEQSFGKILESQNKINNLKTQQAELQAKLKDGGLSDSDQSELDNLERTIPLEEQKNQLRRIRVNLSSQELEALNKIRDAQKAYNQAISDDASPEKIKELKQNLIGTNQAYIDIIENQQMLNDKAQEFKTIFDDIDQIKSIVPELDTKKFTEQLQEIERIKKLLFKTDKEGSFVKTDSGELVKGDAFKNANIKLEDYRTKIKNLPAEIEALKKKVNEPIDETDKAAVETRDNAQSRLNALQDRDADGKLIPDSFGKDMIKEYEKGIEGVKETLENLQSAFENFLDDSADSTGITQTFSNNAQKIAGLQSSISGTKNKALKDKLQLEKESLQIEQDQIIANQKLLKGAQAAKKTKDDKTDDELNEKAQKSSDELFQNRRDQLEQDKAERKRTLEDKKKELLLEAKISSAKRDKNTSEVIKLTRELRRQQIENELRDLRQQDGFTKEQEDVIRKDREGDLEDEIADITKVDNKAGEKTADRVLSAEDKILSSLQQQAKTLRDHLQIKKLIAKFEDDREKRAREKSGRARRDNENLIKAQEKLRQNPNDVKQQKRVAELFDKLDLSEGFANNARNAVGVKPIELRVPSPNPNQQNPDGNTPQSGKNKPIINFEINIEKVVDNAEDLLEQVEEKIPEFVRNLFPF